MKTLKILQLSIVTILLLGFPVSAFAASTPNSALTPTSTQIESPTLASESKPVSYTSPISSTSRSASSAMVPTASSQSIAPSLLRDKVVIDLKSSYLLVSKGFPIKVEAVISGWLPNPCHILQVSVKSSSVNNTIQIEVYSLYDPTQICVALLQPFTTTVSLGSFGIGQFTVLVNGMKLGVFGASPTISSVIAPAPSTSAATKSPTTFATVR